MAVVLTSQRLMVGRWACGLGWVGRWVLRRVGCCRHPRLGGDGVVALVRRPWVGGRHTWRLRVGGVHHCGGCGGGHDRCKQNPSQDPQACHPSLQLSQIRALGSSRATLGPAQWVGGADMLTARPAAHLVQTAAGAGKAGDDGDDEEHENGHANSNGGPEPAKEPVVTWGFLLLARSSSPQPSHPQGAPLLQETLWATQIEELPRYPVPASVSSQVNWGCESI